VLLLVLANLWVYDIIILSFLNVHYCSGRLRYSNRAVIIVILKVSYSCFAIKIVSAVPSHRAHLACYGPLSIVIIGLYVTEFWKITHVGMHGIIRISEFDGFLFRAKKQSLKIFYLFCCNLRQ